MCSVLLRQPSQLLALGSSSRLVDSFPPMASVFCTSEHEDEQEAKQDASKMTSLSPRSTTSMRSSAAFSSGMFSSQYTTSPASSSNASSSALMQSQQQQLLQQQQQRRQRHGDRLTSAMDAYEWYKASGIIAEDNATPCAASEMQMKTLQMLALMKGTTPEAIIESEMMHAYYPDEADEYEYDSDEVEEYEDECVREQWTAAEDDYLIGMSFGEEPNHNSRRFEQQQQQSFHSYHQQQQRRQEANITARRSQSTRKPKDEGKVRDQDESSDRRSPDLDEIFHLEL